MQSGSFTLKVIVGGQVKTCVAKYEDEDTNAQLILNNIHKDIITTNFNKNDLYNNNQNIIIEEVHTTFIITTDKIQKNEANSLINLGNCEEILKSRYNLESTDNLVILIINTKKNPLSGNSRTGQKSMQI